MKFRDRGEAGERLAERLSYLQNKDPLVLSLPRGGVPVGERLVRRLGGILDTLVVRKLGSPDNPEFGFGAIGPDDVAILHPETVEILRLSADQIASVIERETKELHRRMEIFKSGTYARRSPAGRIVLVDDGLATGVSAKAAVQAARKIYVPSRLIFATPVASAEAAAAISGMVDDFVALLIPPALFAIGEWYENFPQVSDEEVVRILEEINSS